MIVIPMAGLSKRFTDAGFNVPKFMLPMDSRCVFDYAILSFERSFKSEAFRFITVESPENANFIRNRCEALGVKNMELIQLPKNTLGQADTVFQGTKDLKNQSITVFNIDTFNFGFEVPVEMRAMDGSLECFIGEGDHWSFAEPVSGNSPLVKRTTEKERVSDFCSTGLYYFKNISTFQQAFEKSKSNNLTTKGEFYIAPLYNLLIQDGLKVGYFLNDHSNLFFCGTPAEYEHCKTAGIENAYQKSKNS